MEFSAASFPFFRHAKQLLRRSLKCQISTVSQVPLPGQQSLLCFPKVLGSLLVATLLFGVVFTSPASTQTSASVSFEGRQTERFVSSLLKDHRYTEAISYLYRGLETLPAGAPRLNLLLLLADCQLDIADFYGAGATLTKAERLAVKSSAKDAKETWQRKLSRVSR